MKPFTETLEAAWFHVIAALAAGLSWIAADWWQLAFVALMWGVVVIGCRKLARAGARGRANITAYHRERRAMTAQPPLPGLYNVIAADGEWPALILCLEAGTSNPECGAWAKVHSALAAEAWVDDHSRDFHEARAIRFELWRRRPDALDAVIQPEGMPPVGEHWREGPYEPPK